MTKDFSVLIPAYNVEKYIDKCLQSILNQSFINFEVIIIDDGSTDGTLKICKKYESLDNRIKVFHQLNMGIIETRNRLIELANGNWVVFIDADDYINKNYLKEFGIYIDSYQSADMFVCDFFSLTNKGEVEIRRPFSNKEEYINQLLSWRKIGTALWAKALRKSLIEKYQIKFEDNIILGEDLCFLSQLAYYANDIIYLPIALYSWNRLNSGSITNNSICYTENYIPLYIKIICFYKEKADYILYAKTINNTLVQVIENIFLLHQDYHELFLYVDNKFLSKISKIKLFFIRSNCYKILLIVRKILNKLNCIR